MKPFSLTLMNAIDVRGLSKHYGSLLALDNVSLRVKKGEFFGFLGPNGAGKTTLINLMTGLAKMQEGTIKVLGKDVVEDYKDARRLIGLSAQEFKFDPFFSIETMLVNQAGFFGIPRKKAKVEAASLLKAFDLYEKRRRLPRTLSGGMKRRLALAKALIHEPRVLVLDEPTAGLDVELRRSLWKYINKINKKGTTIFLTTHYIEEAQELCDRIAIIHKGRIIQSDDKKHLMERFGHKELIVYVDQVDKDAVKDMGAKVVGNSVVVKVSSSNRSGEVLGKIIDSGMKITDVKLREEKLEDIFVRLTR